MGERDVILFDGVEQLSRVRWEHFRWKTRRAGGLVVTVHSPGRLPTLIDCETSPVLLSRIAGEMLGTEPGEQLTQAEELWVKCGGNVREALLEWYDRAACGLKSERR